jgi:CrcB protein
MNYLWIFLGGGIGSLVRFALSGLVAQSVGETFPWGTLVINVTGSFVIGFFDALTSSTGRLASAAGTRGFVMVGICGGYTTFSSFSLQTLSLAHKGQWFKAGSNVGLSVMLCLVAVWAGYATASYINSLKGH